MADHDLLIQLAERVAVRAANGAELVDHAVITRLEDWYVGQRDSAHATLTDHGHRGRAVFTHDVLRS